MFRRLLVAFINASSFDFVFFYVYFSAIGVGNFVYLGLCHLIDSILGGSHNGFEATVPVAQNDVQTMFSQLSFQTKGNIC